MSQLEFDPVSVGSYGTLMLAIVALWGSRKVPFWLYLAVPATALAVLGQRVGPLGMVAVGFLGVLCHAYYHTQWKGLIRVAMGSLILILCVLLGAHRILGFRNWLVLPPTVLSPGAAPIQLYLNFDKPWVGLFLIGWGYSPMRKLREWKKMMKVTLPLFALTAVVLLGFAYLVGYVRWDLKWFSFSWLWLVTNLLFVCVSEEALFRGFLQRELGNAFRRRRHGQTGAWLIASLCFGLAHFPGGWTYVCLATVAGLFYGYGFLKTQRLESSIFIHFMVNAVHFVCLTYPGVSQ